jgi:hypothetical protein
MKTYTLNQLLSENIWTICCAPGCIIHKSFFTQEILTYRLDTDCKYALNKVFKSLPQEGVNALNTLLHTHNNTDVYQVEAERFDIFTMVK